MGKSKTMKDLAEKCRERKLTYPEMCRVFLTSSWRGYYSTKKPLSSEENWNNYLKNGEQL